VHHIFEKGFRRENLRHWEQAVIVGGGITAAQTGMTMALQQPGAVTLLTRHDARVAHFDSDPCWVTSICLKQFHQDRDYTRRRAIIRQVRNRGSMPPDVLAELRKAIKVGVLEQRIAEVDDAAVNEDGKLALKLADGGSVMTDCLILATGFDPARPGGAWLDRVIENEELPLAEYGYPIVDETLCWSPGLYVTGPLAELEVGPVSRNIIGARLAAERIGKRAAS
jgi:pyruvate/2-oxoglutarate dehydrogenase complex dihydrolipoamide dehydrogenase (E3) component